ncbi:MAG: DUF4359 domain-containing protein [Calothrix sp. MO_192.B10]|nr:DUF4359 domain-containing protein [Calothrix sp. MO_192.B10]
MKPSTIITYTGAFGLAVLAILMATTNPSQPKYEQYAVLKLTEYLKDNVCVKTPKILENIIKLNCNKLVDDANPQIKELISATTQRQDYILFSVYRTDLKLNSWVPAYTFETVGAFDQFYTYKAKKQ